MGKEIINKYMGPLHQGRRTSVAIRRIRDAIWNLKEKIAKDAVDSLGLLSDLEERIVELERKLEELEKDDK